MAEHEHADGTVHDHENSDEEHAHRVARRLGDVQILAWWLPADDPDAADLQSTTGLVVRRP